MHCSLIIFLITLPWGPCTVQKVHYTDPSTERFRNPSPTLEYEADSLVILQLLKCVYSCLYWYSLTDLSVSVPTIYFNAKKKNTKMNTNSVSYHQSAVTLQGTGSHFMLAADPQGAVGCIRSLACSGTSRGYPEIIVFFQPVLCCSCHVAGAVF